MSSIHITIDSRELDVPEGFSVKRAALSNGIYIPGLCSHPELNPFKPFTWSEAVWQGDVKFTADSPPVSGGGTGGVNDEFPHCNLCQVSIDGGELARACTTRVSEGMTVATSTPEVISARREALKKILEHHPHACLTCAQREGCDRLQCSMNVPVEERCCELLGRCEIGKVADYIGIPGDTPPYRNLGRSAVTDEPLFIRDYELCIGCTRCVRICRDVRGVDVLGAVMSGDLVRVGVAGGPTLQEAFCRFCGACVEVCPTGTLRDQPGVAVLVEGRAPCSAACPLGIDVPGYIELIAAGLEYEALELIRQRAVLPGVLGYACFHPCEENCRRNALDEPASICALKRYVADVAGEREPRLDKSPSTGRKVAVIGGGPAGLAAAAELLRAGHEVTLFERHDQLGGMLREAIPEFRLPDAVLERDLDYIGRLGLETRLGAAVTPAELRGEGYDAVVAAVGLPEAMRLGVQGEDLEGVEAGLDFLRRAAAGEADRIDGEVLVIGGGNVAVDAARSALRLGGAKVTLVCLESPDEMPAYPGELVEAREEGVAVTNRWGIAAFTQKGGRLEVRLKRCTAVFDGEGRFNPQYDEGDTDTVSADRVIVAIGQRRAEAGELYTAGEGLFIAGDAVSGPSSIVAAMADGVAAARRVNAFLGVSDFEPTPVEFPGNRGELGRDEAFPLRARQQPERTGVAARLTSFAVGEETFTAVQARDEAARCLRCHLRASLKRMPLPPDPWRHFRADLLAEIPAGEGVLVLADESHKVVRIAGAADIRAALEDLLREGVGAAWCRWELDPMYTKRESELLQAHLQAHGEIPGGDELDELF